MPNITKYICVCTLVFVGYEMHSKELFICFLWVGLTMIMMHLLGGEA